MLTLGYSKTNNLRSLKGDIPRTVAMAVALVRGGVFSARRDSVTEIEGESRWCRVTEKQFDWR